MGVLEFQKLPVNTLVGADWKTFKGITQGQTIGKGYKTKYQLTKAICRLLSCLKPIQDRRYDKRLKNQAINMEPVFILGHWRSGTTFVHNVLAMINISVIRRPIKLFSPYDDVGTADV